MNTIEMLQWDLKSEAYAFKASSMDYSSSSEAKGKFQLGSCLALVQVSICASLQLLPLTFVHLTFLLKKHSSHLKHDLCLFQYEYVKLLSLRNGSSVF